MKVKLARGDASRCRWRIFRTTYIRTASFNGNGFIRFIQRGGTACGGWRWLGGFCLFLQQTKVHYASGVSVLRATSTVYILGPYETSYHHSFCRAGTRKRCSMIIDCASWVLLLDSRFSSTQAVFSLSQVSIMPLKALNSDSKTCFVMICIRRKQAKRKVHFSISPVEETTGFPFVSNEQAHRQPKEEPQAHLLFLLLPVISDHCSSTTSGLLGLLIPVQVADSCCLGMCSFRTVPSKTLLLPLLLPL
jgi:hypothetical protein